VNILTSYVIVFLASKLECVPINAEMAELVGEKEAINKFLKAYGTLPKDHKELYIFASNWHTTNSCFIVTQIIC